MVNTVLITGASSGIGKETAIQLAKKGHIVIGAARNPSKMEDLQEFGIQPITMDIANEASVQKGFEDIYKDYQKIDVLINNAGYTQNGFLEELTMEQLRYQFEVNVFGLIRMTQMALPKMRETGQGKIINVGSVGGEFTSPGASAYHASKYALESFTDGMRLELKDFGISVSLIKPGGVATNFIENAAKHYPEPISGHPYQNKREKFKEMLETILDPEKSSFPLLTAQTVANVITKAVESKSPKSRYRVGSTAKVMPLIKRILSDKAFDSMILRQLKMGES